MRLLVPLLFYLSALAFAGIADDAGSPVPELWVMGKTGNGYVPREDARMIADNFTGTGVTVAILDTGIDPNHWSFDDMDGDLTTTDDSKIIAFKDFVNERSDPYDDHGHGTHCAGLIAGMITETIAGTKGGVAPDARLVVVKVMDEEGRCSISNAERALDWCRENRDVYEIDVISLSIGGNGFVDGTSMLEEMCNRMADEGMTICVAAGNSGPFSKSIVVPGNAEKVITVGGVDSEGKIYVKSSRGPTPDGSIKPDLVAVGVGVESARAGAYLEWSQMDGTSMATSQVAGAVAVLLEMEPDLGPEDVKCVLQESADDLGEPGPDNVYGWGMVNLTRAQELVVERYECA